MARDSVDQLMDFLSKGQAAQKAVDEVIEETAALPIELAAIEALDRVKATTYISIHTRSDGVASIPSGDLPVVLKLEIDALVAVAALVGWQLHDGDGEGLRTAICELEKMAIRVRCTKDRIEREKVRGADGPG